MSQVQSVISGKNQVVIPAPVRHALKLKAGDKLLWQVVKVKNQTKAVAEPEPKSWADYTQGLGKYIWQGIDIGAYIQQLRREWQ